MLLVLLLVAAEQFGDDVVLGAMLAGMVLRSWTRRMDMEVEHLEDKLDAVGYGIFIPLFFVSSGMTLDVQLDPGRPGPAVHLPRAAAARARPAVAAGVPGVLPLRQRLEMTFITATTMPLLIALAEIGLSDGVMLPSNAAALVGAGVLSVLHLPGDRGRDAPARSARPGPARPTPIPSGTGQNGTGQAPPGPSSDGRGHGIAAYR